MSTDNKFPATLEGQSVISHAILEVIYRACQRGDSPERMHAAIMALLPDASQAPSEPVVPSNSVEFDGIKTVPPSTLAQQIASAQAEVAAWPEGKLARVKAAGGDQP